MSCWSRQGLTRTVLSAKFCLCLKPVRPIVPMPASACQEERVGAGSEGFAELLRRPCGHRLAGDVEGYQPATPHLHHHEDLEDLERGHYRHAEIAGQKPMDVVPDEGRPVLAGDSATPAGCCGRHVPADGAGRHPHPELQEQPGGDPLLAPGRIPLDHLCDRVTEICWEAQPPGAAPPAVRGGTPIVSGGSASPRPPPSGTAERVPGVSERPSPGPA